jgi:uncharacterized protein (TIGR02301 family)
MRAIFAISAAALALVWAAGALAQSRTPAERQTLSALAFELGRSHALRQVCAGPADQFWRERMSALVATEAPDPAFEGQLNSAFNAGFTTAQTAFPRCTPRARGEAADAAARGRALAESLAAPVADDDPSR